eukprot:9576728-Lingulodinium_polyedra.AAC.1
MAVIPEDANDDFEIVEVQDRFSGQKATLPYPIPLKLLSDRYTFTDNYPLDTAKNCGQCHRSDTTVLQTPLQQSDGLGLLMNLCLDD